MGKRCGKLVEVVPLANRCYDSMITVKLFFLHSTRLTWPVGNSIHMLVGSAGKYQ